MTESERRDERELSRLGEFFEKQVGPSSKSSWVTPERVADIIRRDRDDLD